MRLTFCPSNCIYMLSLTLSLAVILLVTSNDVYGLSDMAFSKVSLLIDTNMGNLKDSLKDKIESRLNNVQNLLDQEVNTGNPISIYEGKISKAQLNLENGQVEKTFFGNWYLNTTNGENIEFEATFYMTDILENTQPYTFEIDNVRINSILKNNDDVKYGGLSDITRQSTSDGKVSALKDIPTTISIIENEILVVTFEDSDFPLTGIVIKSN